MNLAFLSLVLVDDRFVSFDKYINVLSENCFLLVLDRREGYRALGLFQQNYTILHGRSTMLPLTESSLLVRFPSGGFVDDKLSNSRIFQVEIDFVQPYDMINESLSLFYHV